jgi:hypothetical protein
VDVPLVILYSKVGLDLIDVFLNNAYVNNLINRRFDRLNRSGKKLNNRSDV